MGSRRLGAEDGFPNTAGTAVLPSLLGGWNLGSSGGNRAQGLKSQRSTLQIKQQ